jgi:hypothetical protein
MPLQIAAVFAMHYTMHSVARNHLDTRCGTRRMAPGHQKVVWFVNQKTEAVMRGSVAALVLGLTTVTLSAPAHALSGPMPSSKLQNPVSTNVEQVVVVRRGGAVARGPRGGVAAVGPTTGVRPSGYRPGVRPGAGYAPH